MDKVLPKKSSNSKKPPTLPDLPSTHKDIATTNKSIVKEDLIHKILKYQSNKRFGPIVNKELGFKYTRTQLTKYSIDNLEAILHRIRTHLNTRNMDQVFQHMVEVSAKGYEDLVCGFGYDIDGFSELLLSNPAFHDAFERWKIERKIPEIPPSFQLMYIIASTTYIAHNRNASKPASIVKQQQIVQKNEIKEIINTNKQADKENEKQSIKSNMHPGDIII